MARLSRPSGRRALAMFAVAVPVLAAILYLTASYLAFDAFSRPVRQPVTGPTLVSAPVDAIAFRTSDGLTLRGWYLRGASDRAVILVHGRGANRSEFHGRSERIADFLIKDGYSVLMFDLRGHGESEGTRFTLGYLERHDVVAAIDFLRARGFTEEHIGMIAISMGGASALASLTIDPRIGPMVIDSSYADIAVIMAEGLQSERGLPAWLVPGILLIGRLSLGVQVD